MSAFSEGNTRITELLVDEIWLGIHPTRLNLIYLDDVGLKPNAQIERRTICPK